MHNAHRDLLYYKKSFLSRLNEHSGPEEVRVVQFMFIPITTWRIELIGQAIIFRFTI